MASVGPQSPATGADDAAVGTSAWTNPGNILSSNDSYATNAVTAGGGSNNTVTTHYVRGTNFGFSIPSTAVIDGIVLEVERSAGTSPGNTVDSTIRLRKNSGFVGDNKAVGGTWPASDAYQTYGSSSDLWGTTWTPAEINDAGFGAGVSAFLDTVIELSTETCSVDHMRITVYYTETAGHFFSTQIV